MELRDIPLFASLSEEALQRLRQRLRRRRYEEGEVILRAGDPGGSCMSWSKAPRGLSSASRAQRAAPCC